MTSITKPVIAPDVSGIVDDQPNNASTVTTPFEDVSGYIEDAQEMVAVSANDTNIKHLEDAFQAAGAVDIAVDDEGGDESLIINVDNTLAQFNADKLQGRLVNPLSIPQAGDTLIWNGSNLVYGSPVTGLNAIPFVAEGRLTLTTAVPVTTADVVDVGVVYYTPYIGNRITLWDVTIEDWRVFEFEELELDMLSSAFYASGALIDVFAYYDDANDELKLSASKWTNATTRSTALEFDGTWVQSGSDRTLRYLGTYRCSATALTSDRLTARFLWNMYHRIPRKMLATQSGSWTYNSNSTWRGTQNNTTSRLQFVVGLAEDIVESRHILKTDDNTYWQSGIGIDSTSSNSADWTGDGEFRQSNVAGDVTAHYTAIPGIGYHFLQGLERTGVALATYTAVASGMIGTIRA